MIPKDIKNDFPIFRKEGSLVYLDSAATSQTPLVVLDAMYAYYTDFRANIHRGLYEEGIVASEAYEHARREVAMFIGAEPREVIFTSGATASSNMLVAMLEHSGMLKAGDEIVTTVMEHHASLIPLQKLALRNSLALKVTQPTVEAIEKAITPQTKIVSVCLASNVTGTINDIARIARRAHEVGALVMSDATAAVGHIPVDVKTLGVDFLYFSGHKMCGPTGVGVLWGKYELLENMEPGVYGGGIVDAVTVEHTEWRSAPERFEAGTPNIAGVIGLGTATRYLTTIGLETISAHVQALTLEATKKLEEIPGVHIVAEKDVAKNVGIISFTIDGVHPHDVAEILGRGNVAVRAGHHCAMPFITALGLSGTTRASFYLYNTSADIDALVRGVSNVKEIFKK